MGLSFLFYFFTYSKVIKMAHLEPFRVNDYLIVIGIDFGENNNNNNKRRKRRTIRY